MSKMAKLKRIILQGNIITSIKYFTHPTTIKYEKNKTCY